MTQCVYKRFMLTASSNYRNVLLSEFDRRTAADPRYSMRSFAKDLGLAPSRLCEVLRYRQGLSRAVGERIGKDLGLGDQETATFCDLIEAEHARSDEKRKLAKLRLHKKFQDTSYLSLAEDAFAAISDWYHLAILQVLECRPRANVEEIARRLGIHVMQAQNAVDRLIRLGMLSRTSDAQLLRVHDFVATTDEIPSAAIRKFHHQILSKAAQSVDLQTVEQRNLSANFIAIDSHQLPKMKEKLKKMRRDFVKEFSSPSPNTVYCLSAQFFELTKRGVL